MKDVEIYPSSWYYNACVHGFLEVLAWGLGDRGIDIVEEQFLQNDGSVRIPGELMEAIFSTQDVPAPNGYELREVPDDVRDLKRIAWWWVEKSIDMYFVKDKEKETWSNLEKANKVIGRLHYKDGIYPNWINLGAIKTAEGRCQELNRLLTISIYQQQLDPIYHCSFCNQIFIAEKEANKYGSALTRSISIIIGSSPESFPNRMWNGLPNEIFCHQCRSYLLFYHLNLNIYKPNFINTDSLGLNWYLNNLINNTKANSSQTLTKAFRNTPSFRQNLSIWGLQNIEIFSHTSVDGNRTKIEHMLINSEVAHLLIQPRISSYLNYLPTKPVWELFSKKQFSYFSILIYKNLNVIVKGKKNDQEAKDPEIIVDVKKTDTVIRLIHLYEAILDSTKPKEAGVSMNLNLKEIKEAAKSAPLNLDTNRGLVFRLLELSRLSKKSEVYYLLLRFYTAQKVMFPEVLSKTFLLEDDELFKTGVYAYISYLPQGKKDN